MIKLTDWVSKTSSVLHSVIANVPQCVILFPKLKTTTFSLFFFFVVHGLEEKQLLFAEPSHRE